MANGDSQLLSDVEEIKERQREEDIAERVAARIGGSRNGGGPGSIVSIGGSGGGGSDTFLALGLGIAALGGGYYAYQNGYLSQILGPVVTGPGSVQQGKNYVYNVVGVSPGGQFESDLTLSDGTQKVLTPNHNADAAGKASVSLAVDQSIPVGMTILSVTDLTTGKVTLMKKKFQVLSGSSSGGGGGGGGMMGQPVLNGPSLMKQLDPSYTFTVKNANPGSTLRTFVQDNNGRVYEAAKDTTADGSGNATISISMIIGGSIGIIPLGPALITVVEVSDTGLSGTLTVTVV